jgi:acetoin utilization deacetylase AcuC-like enzyme
VGRTVTHVEPLGFVTDPLFLEHASPGHPERPARLAAILEQLDRTGQRARMRELTPRAASDDELLAVHTPAAIERLDDAASRGGDWLDPDTYVSPVSAFAARRAAGATLVATEAVLAGEVRAAFAAVRPPGHHATRERQMGFCLLNNVAVAAAAALDAGLERVAIVDWDVHHGNGTQAIFEAEPRVFYASTHAAPFYPGTGAVSDTGEGAARGTKVNIPLPAGTGDAGFVAAYEQAVLPALDRFRPQLLLVSCGWDAHARDPLAPLAVSTAGYTAVARLVIEAAASLCEGQLVVALEGGYDEHALAWCASTLSELLLDEEPTPDPQPTATAPEPDVTPILRAARTAIGLD